MGQKVNPTGFRLSVNKSWKSNWFSAKKDFPQFLKEDKALRDHLSKKANQIGASAFKIQRMGDKVEVTIVTSRPGAIIGKKGADVEELKAELTRLVNRDVWVEVEEIKRPEMEAKLIAESVRQQLEKRMPYKRVVKRAIQQAMDAGALGIKVMVSGRLGGAEIARSEWFKEGRIPLHTLRAKIQYATSESQHTYGKCGIKVWVNLGDEEDRGAE
jgi:small subunit ribosomal protein S3